MNLSIRGLAVIAGLSVAGFTPTQTAEACSCLQPDTVYSYRTHDASLVGRVVASQAYSNYVVYTVRVGKSIKGCLPEGRRIRVVTPRGGATCQAFLNIGDNYVIYGNERSFGSRTALFTTSCSGNTELSRLDPWDRSFLAGRSRRAGESPNASTAPPQWLASWIPARFRATVPCPRSPPPAKPTTAVVATPSTTTTTTRSACPGRCPYRGVGGSSSNPVTLSPTSTPCSSNQPLFTSRAYFAG